MCLSATSASNLRAQCGQAWSGLGLGFGTWLELGLGSGLGLGLGSGDGSVMVRLTTRRSTTLTGGGGSVARSTPCFLALAICRLYSSTTLRFWLASLDL